MKLMKRLSRFEGFEMDWRRLMLQWIIIMLLGILMVLASLVNSSAIVLSAKGFSWLPVSGLFIFSLGLVECLDAALAKRQRDVLQNLQVGVLDTVVGALIILGISGDLSRISMMIAAFLIVRGLVRIALVYALNLPFKFSTSMVGIISVILGILVFQQWPSDEGWFISLCLSIEITFRGWAGISFALWIRQQQQKKQKYSGKNRVPV